MKFNRPIIIFLISLIFLNFSLIYATSINKNNDKYLRIHIVANSDSIDDQLLKYTVAKHVNTYIESITQNCHTKKESKQVVEQNIQHILNICHNTISNNNSHYTVKAQLGKISYGEKQTDNVYMQAGVYDSLKIIIGDGNGQNWWSLIYPTTFNDISQDDVFEHDVDYSIGIIEWIKNIFN